MRSFFFFFLTNLDIKLETLKILNNTNTFFKIEGYVWFLKNLRENVRERK